MAKQAAKGRKTPASATKAPDADKISAESIAPVIDRIPPEVHEPTAPKVSPPQAATPVEATETKQKSDAQRTAEPPKESPAPQAKRQGGIIPLVIGGLVAGVIGFAVATFTTPTSDGPLAEQVARQGATIAELEQQLASLLSAETPNVDLSPIEETQEVLAADIDRLDAAIAALGEQIDSLPTTSVNNGSAPDVAAYEAELDALRSQMQEQIAGMTQMAQSQLDSARAEAAMIEENAAAAARRAAGRAALARVQTGLESGAPLGSALDDLQDVLDAPLPDALLSVRDGVPTLASLQETFPDAARVALATARSEGVAGEETSGLGAFLRNQLDVRSVTPREGNTADAILSRAEAAVKSGRLSDALAEIAALPDVARAEMADWLALAETRASAVTAVDMLATTLNDN